MMRPVIYCFRSIPASLTCGVVRPRAGGAFRHSFQFSSVAAFMLSSQRQSHYTSTSYSNTSTVCDSSGFNVSKKATPSDFTEVYNTALRTLIEQNNTKDATSLFNGMVTKGSPRPNLNTFITMFMFHKQRSEIRQALRCYRLLIKRGFVPDIKLINDVIVMFLQLGRQNTRNYEEGLDVFMNLNRTFIEPDSKSFRLAIFACSKLGEWELAYQLLQEMESNEFDVDSSVYTSAIASCKREGNWKHVHMLLKEMEKSKIPITEATYSAAISSLIKDGLADIAVGLFHEMKNQGINPKRSTYGALIATCMKEGKWEIALSVSKLADVSGVVLSHVEYSAVLKTLERGNRYEEVLEVFEDMKLKGTMPCLACYTAAIRALSNHKKWEECIILLREMDYCNLDGNVSVYNSVIRAFHGSDQIDIGLSLVEEMARKGIRYNGATIKALKSIFLDSRDFNDYKDVLEAMSTISKYAALKKKREMERKGTRKIE